MLNLVCQQVHISIRAWQILKISGHVWTFLNGNPRDFHHVPRYFFWKSWDPPPPSTLHPSLACIVHGPNVTFAGGFHTMPLRFPYDFKMERMQNPQISIRKRRIEMSGISRGHFSGFLPKRMQFGVLFCRLLPLAYAKWPF